MKRLLYIFLLSSIFFNLQAQPKHELRAAWLTTNFRIDWPSKPFYNSDDINEQQDELIDILDKLKSANINTVFLQVRFKAEVIYRSKIEPMTPFIAGVENTWSKYDPLTFAIKEAHNRGIELHAWFVVYNAGYKGNSNKTTNKQKDIIVEHENEYWFDPGNPNTNKYLLSVVKELVKEYDIDGLHLDYVRYPAKASDFPDNDSYKKYSKGKPKGEWRRNNVNQFVHSVYDIVKSVKPWVQISAATVPFYTKLADTKKNHWTALYDAFQDPEEWLKNGKVDFIVPMTYNKEDFFNPAIKDWMTRSHERYIVPGIGAYLLNETEPGGDWDISIVKQQIEYSRAMNTHGNAFFSTRHILLDKKGLYTEMKDNYYKYPALPYPLDWLWGKNMILPAPINFKIVPAGNYLFLKWSELKAPDKNAFYYNLYRSKTSPVDISDPSNLIATRIDGSSTFIPIFNSDDYYYVITTYDRYHNESAASEEIYFKR